MSRVQADTGFLTQEREGFSSIGDAISEHQTVSSIQDVSDQTTNRTLEHLPLTGLRTEHLHSGTESPTPRTCYKDGMSSSDAGTDGAMMSQLPA